jgi:hypothetical protein
VPDERAVFEDSIAGWDAVNFEASLIEAGMIGDVYHSLSEGNSHSCALD